ncbi:MAG: hypothetical protein ACOC93_05165, partial [Planctomycetota bacterium]
SYTLRDYDGSVWTGNGSGEYTDYEVNQPYGIFGVDRQDGDIDTNTRILGSIAYTLPGQRVNWDGYGGVGAGVFVNKLNGYGVTDTMSYLSHEYRTFLLMDDDADAERTGGEDLLARGLTSVGGRGELIASQDSTGRGWSTGGIESVATGAELYESKGTLLRGGSQSGANLVYRYENGVRTDELLLSWPMNQRIIDAMRLGGYEDPVDVNQTLLRLGEDDAPTGPTETLQFSGDRQAWFIDAHDKLATLSLDGPGRGEVTFSSRTNAATAEVHIAGSTGSSSLRIEGDSWQGMSSDEAEIRGSLKKVVAASDGLSVDVGVDHYVGEVAFGRHGQPASVRLSVDAPLEPAPMTLDAALPSALEPAGDQQGPSGGPDVAAGTDPLTADALGAAQPSGDGPAASAAGDEAFAGLATACAAPESAGAVGVDDALTTDLLQSMPPVGQLIDDSSLTMADGANVRRDAALVAPMAEEDHLGLIDSLSPLH